MAQNFVNAGGFVMLRVVATFAHLTLFNLILLALILGVALATVADGDRAFAAGNYAVAIAEYEAAVTLRASNVAALVKLARAKTHLAETLTGTEAERRYAEAESHARAALALAPENAEAHLELARALGRLAQFRGVLQSLGLAGEVQSSLERALQLEPDLAAAYHALALWHLEVPWLAGGRTAEVRPLFERAIALEPESPIHHVEYGLALERLGDAAAGRAQLETALALPARDYADKRALEHARTHLGTPGRP